MLKLMAPRGGRTTARRFFSSLSDAVRSVVAPAALIVEQAPATAPDPADTYPADDLPDVADVEAAAAAFDEAADLGRAADRAKRKARKLLDKLPSGTYGRWDVFRVASARQTPDLVAIRATYERLGLGDVPMRDTAPSLKVERVESPVVELAPVLAQVAA